MARALSKEAVLLTNSFGGVKKDIEAIQSDFDCVVMFGIDKNLKDSVRIESAAEREGTTLFSALNLQTLKDSFTETGLKAEISETPTHYLCNEAYWYALKKFAGKAVFIHIPTFKYTDDAFIEKIKHSFKNS